MDNNRMHEPLQKCNRGYTRAYTRGYTLIEILIVLLIVSIVTSVALLSIGHNENKRLETFANNMSQMITLAEEQAILQPAVLGLYVGRESFHFVSYETTEGEKNKIWVPIKDSVLGKHDIPNDMEIGIQIGKTQIESADKKKHDEPQIIISTNGDVTPFTIYVGKVGKKPRYAIIANADGDVTTKYLLSS